MPNDADAAPSAHIVYGAIGLAQLTFSGFHILTELALDQDMPPSLFAFLRLVIASPVVLTLAALRDRTVVPLKHHPRLFVLGMLGVGGSQGLALAGQYFTDPINLAVAQPLQPIMTAALSVALGLEQFSRLKAAGILVSSVGCVLVVLLGAKDAALAADAVGSTGLPPSVPAAEHVNPHGNFLLGNLCLFCNCLCMSVFLILQKPMLAVLPAWTTTGWVLTWGALPMLAWVVVASLTTQTPSAMLGYIRTASPLEWVAITYGGIMAAGVAMMLISFGVKYAGATAAASLVPLQPLFSTILAVVVLRDYPERGQYLGAIFIVGGLWLVLYSNKAPKAPPPMPPEMDVALYPVRSVSDIAAAAQAAADADEEEDDAEELPDGDGEAVGSRLPPGSAAKQISPVSRLNEDRAGLLANSAA